MTAIVSMSRVTETQRWHTVRAWNGQTWPGQTSIRDWVHDVNWQQLGTSSKSVIDKAHMIVLRKFSDHGILHCWSECWQWHEGTSFHCPCLMSTQSRIEPWFLFYIFLVEHNAQIIYIGNGFHIGLETAVPDYNKFEAAHNNGAVIIRYSRIFVGM